MSSENSSSSKKKIAASAVAVALAAVLMIGGTFSYLKSQSTAVVNNFTANTDYVDLSETTGDDYNIIPGTSEEKDPTITYAATVETYVFVEITDATDGLVTWEIADGWTLLSETTDKETGVTTYVYYQVVDATGYDEDGNLTSNTLQVLKNNTVYYSAELDNDDMLESSTDEDGNTTYTLKDDLTLTFQAYTIQYDSLEDSPAAAYAFATGNETTSVSTEDALSTALSNGSTYITLSSDITLNSALTIDEDSVVLIDLNGYTLTAASSHAITVEDDAYLVVTGGTIASTNTSGSYSAVDNEGGTVTLENVTVTNTSHYAIINHGTMTLDNCTVTSESTTSSMIENGWQSASSNTSGENSVMIINGGTYTAGFYAVKNDDYGVLTINDGTFTSTGNGVLLNWNDATINGGTFETQSSSAAAIYNASADSGSTAYSTYEAGTLKIYNGTFIYNGTYAITGYESGTAEYTTVYGGTFSTDSLFKYSGRGAVADGYTLSPNSDGTYSVVESSTSSNE